ncbi:DUF1433 domain-containing protein [Virgibacillus sp. 179-BFC.A HS]|uniref:DUF1433 domain-containing protein n=1 Tax=Tigheibacillus jepli TaxID=3035914 RepID=A0ABU5CCL7_9BACI|nr:DUF1433 domain-containing protein [Virgibacillus sp. 179-BFC.A HS]MDY0404072.1 DUF1433 domain-containing protein [Virgibacillus sp. 179-BFC.A HS]
MRIAKLFLSLLLIIQLGGCFVKTGGYDAATIEKGQKTVESYIRNNYEDIETVEFNNDHSNPMGGLMIRGKVNGKAGFVVHVDANDFTVRSIGEKEGFPDLKKECREKVCPY